MLMRLSTSSLIPLLLPIVFVATSFAQENPFGDPLSGAATTKANSTAGSAIAEEGSSKSVPDENEKLKAFQEQLKAIEANFTDQVKRNDASLSALESLVSENKRLRLRGKTDEQVSDVFKGMQARIDEQNRSLSDVKKQNEALKKHIVATEKSESELRQIAEEATKNRNLMHQQLFETLLFSDKPAQQQLAINHFFECSGKYDRSPVSFSSEKLLKRMSSLTKSDSSNIKKLAAQCLWQFRPESAMELGIQFGSRWAPVEYSRSSAKTKQIYKLLDEQMNVAYEEEELTEFVETLQQAWQVGVKLDAEIDPDQRVTYKSIDRPMFDSLSDLLDSLDLGFAIVNDEIRVMKKSNPALIVDSTYNVAGLNSLAQIETEDLVKILQESFTEQGVKFATIGDHVISAKTTEQTQRKIQEKIASLTPRIR